MQERASGRRVGTRQVSASDMVQPQGAHLKELPAHRFLRSPANMRAPLRLLLMLIETFVLEIEQCSSAKELSSAEEEH